MTQMDGVKRSFELPEELAARVKLTAELADRAQVYLVREALDVRLPSLASLNTLLENGEQLTWPPAPAEVEPEPEPDPEPPRRRTRIIC